MNIFHPCPSFQGKETQKHTTILVGNDLGLVVDSEGNRAVGVSKGDTDGDSVTGLDAGLDAVVLRHLGERRVLSRFGEKEIYIKKERQQAVGLLMCPSILKRER